jgi:Reverse transcriptase (RNA-dependent DNA polymerase)
MMAEFHNVESKNVWRIVKKSSLPKGSKIIVNRWVYAQKDDGRYRARTVAKVCSQVAGKDFHENHTPVVHDTTLHLILLIKIRYGLTSRQFDVETAFLYGTLEEEIYMDFPEGYTEYLLEKGLKYSSQENCVLLLRALYGLVQAARQWWKKITEFFAKLNFFATPADTCLFVKKKEENKTTTFIILYVDDG